MYAPLLLYIKRETKGMKKIIYSLIFFASLLLISSGVYAAGTVTRTTPDTKNDGHLRIVTLSWTADASAATVPATTISNVDGYVYTVITNPGSTAPTDNYDITLTDSDGVDVMGGATLNRDTANSEQVFSLDGFLRYTKGNLTFTLSNNSVNSATGTVIIHIYKEN